MDWRKSLAQMTGNYRELDKKALRMKKSWDEVEKLLSKSGSGKNKKKQDKNKK